MYLEDMNLWDATVALPALWWCVVKHVMPLPKPIHLTHARKRLKPRDGPSSGKELAGGCVFGRQLGSFVFVKKEDGEFIYITIITSSTLGLPLQPTMTPARLSQAAFCLLYSCRRGSSEVSPGRASLQETTCWD